MLARNFKALFLIQSTSRIHFVHVVTFLSCFVVVVVVVIQTSLTNAGTLSNTVQKANLAC